jgi:(p)ppGpp synthase/HD superfamily hydrolase
MSEQLPPFARGLTVTPQAIAYARDRHADQRRQVDAAPFILHPLEVAMLLHGRGYDDEVVAAGALHDVLEKTSAQRGDLEARFGARVAGLVAAVSDPERVEGYEERKAALRRQVAAADPDAQAIYAADKVAKARELRAQAARLHVSLADPGLRQRLSHYERSLETLQQALPDAALVHQLEFELWALRQLPPPRDPPSG